MGRIYNGFNALGLGRAINETQNALNEQRVSGLQALGDAAQNYVRAKAEREREQKRRQSALDFLTGRGGMDSAQAEQMVDTITPEQAVLYLTGRLDKAADTADERGYEQTIHDRNRGEQISDRDAEWAHNFEDWQKKNGITYEQAVKQAQFGQLMQQLGLISSKDWGNSRQGVDQYNDTISALKTFSEKNPEFLDVLGLIQQGMKGSDNKYFDEDIKARLRELGGKQFTDKQREDYLKELIDNDKFSYILGNEDFNDSKSKFTENVDNKKLMPYVNLQKLIGNNTTQTQRKKQINEAEHAARIKSVKEQIQSARRGKAEWPKLSKSEIEELKKDKTFAQMMKGHY